MLKGGGYLEVALPRWGINDLPGGKKSLPGDCGVGESYTD